MQFIAFLGHFVATLMGVIAIYWLWPSRPWPRCTPAMIGIGVLGFEYSAFKVAFPSEPFWDFVLCYYPAGKAALEYDIPTLQALYERVVQGFVNIPIVAYLFAPFAVFDTHTAALLYTATGVVAAAYSWWLLARLTGLAARERWILAVLFLANGPLLNSLKFGNTSHFILLGLVSSLHLLRTERSLLAGVILGAATVMKPALGLFGVFFLLRGDIRGLVGFASTGIITTLSSLALFGWDFNWFWFNTSILQFGHQWFSTFSVQSIPGFLLRLRDDAEILTSWRPVTPTAVEYRAAKLLVMLLYLVAATCCLMARRKANTDDVREKDSRRDLQFLLVVCLCAVGSPLSWSHYYAWLLIPAAFFLRDQALARKMQPMHWLSWLAILLISPIVVWPLNLSSPTLMAIYQTTLVSNLLFGGLLWLGLVCWSMIVTTSPRLVEYRS